MKVQDARKDLGILCTIYHGCSAVAQLEEH